MNRDLRLQWLALDRSARRHKCVSRLRHAALLDDPYTFDVLRAGLSADDWRWASGRLSELEYLGVDFLSVDHFPKSWLRFSSLPIILYFRGRPNVLRQRLFGIVGSRAASMGARLWTQRFARDRCQMGMSIVSGGAIGIDAAAHRGALDSGSGSVVCLGCPIDEVYPSENKELFAEILNLGGLLLSEYGPGEKPGGVGHARRNRFIAGMAEALLLVEAEKDSGSLGAARYAHRIGTRIWTSPVEVGRHRRGLDTLLEAGQAELWPGDRQTEAKVDTDEKST